MSNVLKASFFASVLILSGPILPFAFAQNSTVTLSPLKQFENGVSAYNVKCKEGFVLVIKTSDSSPACVMPQTAQVLIERGWGTFISGPTSIDNSNCEYSNFANATIYVTVDPQAKSNPTKIVISPDILTKYPKLQEAFQRSWIGVNMAIVVSPKIYLSDITENEAKSLLDIWSSHIALTPNKKIVSHYLSISYDLAAESAGSFYDVTITENYRC